MSDPTLKIRVALTRSHLGRDCGVMAKELLGDEVMVLDAKWGRSPDEWRETGGGWGRKHLSATDAGYVKAVKDLLDQDDDNTLTTLVRIIDGLTA